jgi:hypothetical protein
MARSLEAAVVGGHWVERLGVDDHNGHQVRGHRLERPGAEDKHKSARIGRASVASTRCGEANGRGEAIGTECGAPCMKGQRPSAEASGCARCSRGQTIRHRAAGACGRGVCVCVLGKRDLAMWLVWDEHD